MNAPHASPSDPIQSTATRPRRRWWVYVLWVFGSLFGLAVVAVVSLWLYWNSLVKTYTSTKPKDLPAVEAPEGAFEELKQRWDAYALLFIRRSPPIPPFELTADELNLFATKYGPFKKRAYAEVLENKLRVQFSLPLGESGMSSLQGRFLNGIANLQPVYKDGRLSVRVASIEANGKPLPKWIQKRFRQPNLAEALNRRPEFDLAIRALERIEVSPGKIVLHPVQGTAR